MRGAARRRVFGGNAGLWLFQKKFRAKDNDTNEQQQNASVSAVRAKDGDAGHIAFVERDSTKCSPESTQSSRSSIYRGVINSEQIIKKSEMIPRTLDISNTHGFGKSHKRGVFGVRKRHFESNGSDSDTSVVITASSGQGNTKRYRPLTTTCSVQSSTASQFYSSSSSSLNKTALSDAEESDEALFTETTMQGNIIPSSVITDVENLTQQSESTSIFDFDKDVVTQQLGSKTSLDVARQFFAQLDSDQTLLQIEDVRRGAEPPSTRKKSKVVRTTRGKLPYNVAEREYRKYCQACQSSKVKPFSLERFLKQRSEYFRVGDIFDGMFDE